MILLLILAAQPIVRGIGAILHLGAALACAAAARRGRARFWTCMALLQAGIALEAALGLRHHAAELARNFFRAQGWYGQRWTAQAMLSILGVLVVGIAAGGIFWRLGKVHRQNAAGGKEGGKSEGRACQWAAIGAALSLTMMVLTAVSLHAVEAALAWPVRWLNAGIVLRALGAALVILGAWRFLHAQRLRYPPAPSPSAAPPGRGPGGPY